MILALDISLNVGWALGAAGEQIAFGTRIFKGISGDDARVGRRFRAWVDEFLAEKKPAAVVIERPFLRGDSSWLLFGMAWEAHRAAECLNIPRYDYAPNTIKKFMTGDGRAKKPQMVQAARLRGYNVGTDHEADAIALLLCHAASRPKKPVDRPPSLLL